MKTLEIIFVGTDIASFASKLVAFVHFAFADTLHLRCMPTIKLVFDFRIEHLIVDALGLIQIVAKHPSQQRVFLHGSFTMSRITRPR